MKKYRICFIILLLCGCSRYHIPVTWEHNLYNHAQYNAFKYCQSRTGDSELCRQYANCVGNQFIEKHKKLWRSHPEEAYEFSQMNTGSTPPAHENPLSPVENLQEMIATTNYPREISKSVAQLYMSVRYDYCGKEVFSLLERCESLAFTGVYPDWCLRDNSEPWKEVTKVKQSLRNHM